MTTYTRPYRSYSGPAITEPQEAMKINQIALDNDLFKGIKLTEVEICAFGEKAAGGASVKATGVLNDASIQIETGRFDPKAGTARHTAASVAEMLIKYDLHSFFTSAETISPFGEKYTVSRYSPVNRTVFGR